MATSLTSNQKITPFLWFENNAEEAMKYYTSIFKNSKIIGVTRYGDAGPGKKGDVMAGTFEIEGQTFHVLNGNPSFKFNLAVSFFISCTTQEEVDYFWEKLSEGGEKIQCGWLKDKFGLAWQVVPSVMGELLNHPDAAKAARVMTAMMNMTKFIIKDLENA